MFYLGTDQAREPSLDQEIKQAEHQKRLECMEAEHQERLKALKLVSCWVKLNLTYQFVFTKMTKTS